MGRVEESFDALRESMGLGKWQYIQYLFLTGFYLAWSNNLIGILILGFVPDFTCLPANNTVNDRRSFPETLNLTYGQSCEWYDLTRNSSHTCNGRFIYAEPKEASIVSEWDLVCGHTYLVDLSQTLFNAGYTFGSIVFTLIGDKYGRRKVVIWGHVGFILVGLANCFANTITMFVIIRTFLGALLAGTGMVGWVVLLELFTAKHRTMAARGASMIWGVCMCCLPALGYLMKGLSWRYVQLVMCSYCIVLIGQYIFLDETLKWLIANDKEKEVITIVAKAKYMNGMNPDESLAVKQYFPDDNSKDESLVLGQADANINTELCVLRSDDENTNISKLTLISHRRLRIVFIVMCFVWFTNDLTYTGLYMLTTAMSGDRYLNLFLSTVADLAGAILTTPFILRYGRKKMMICMHTLAAVSLISASVLYVTTDGNTRDIAVTCAVNLGKFSITGSFGVVYMYTPEIYPTNIRSFGLGLTSLAARLSGFLSPFTASVAREVPWAPPAVFGGFCLFVAFISPLLPETRGKPLPQTLEDLEKLYSNDTPKSETGCNGTENIPLQEST